MFGVDWGRFALPIFFFVGAAWFAWFGLDYFGPGGLGLLAVDHASVWRSSRSVVCSTMPFSTIGPEIVSMLLMPPTNCRWQGSGSCQALIVIFCVWGMRQISGGRTQRKTDRIVY